MSRLIVDACTIVNFASIDKVGLLETMLRGRGSWSTTVHAEVLRLSRRKPHLVIAELERILGPTIEVDERESSAIELIRRSFATPLSRPSEHLGEAECVHLMMTRHEFTNSILITDDNHAAKFARQQHLQVWHSMHLLADAYTMGDVGCPEAYELLCAMADAGEGVFVPKSHIDVC